MTTIGPEFDRDRLNEQGRETALQEAEHLRVQLIGFVRDAIITFVLQDQKTQTYVEEGILSPEDAVLFVKEDIVVAFEDDDKPVRTLSLLLERDKEIGQRGEDKIRLYLPISDDAALESKFDPMELLVPAKVYVEEVGSQGAVIRHEITKDSMYEYESAYDTGQQVVKDDFHPDHIHESISLRVHSGLPYLSRLFEDMVNMKAVPDTGVHTTQ